MHEYAFIYYVLKNQFGSGRKWKTLIHNGVMFPPEYVLHGIPVIYEGNKVLVVFYRKYE